MTIYHSAHRDVFTPDASLPVSGVSESSPTPPAPPYSTDLSNSHNVAANTARVTDVGPEFYQAAVAHAGIPIIPMDVEGRILAWNNAARRSSSSGGMKRKWWEGHWRF